MPDYYSSAMQEMDSLNNNHFAHDIRECKRCPLSETRFCSCPGWFSNLPLDILFVGMSPGQDEDEVGRPFVGKAGRKLMELADRVKLVTDETTLGFTNIVRCHTPENRPPTGHEIQACSTWMRCEFDMTEAKVVLLLGGVAISLAFPGKKIGEVAGSARAIGSTVYIASYHPAAGLHKRSPVIEASILHSLRLAREVLTNAVH